MSDSAKRLVVIAPWLQGGGAQAAMFESVRRAAYSPTLLVVLFNGNRDFDGARELFDEVLFLGNPKSPLGVLKAARQLKRMLEPSDRVYSLMRGSHVVLGLLPSPRLRKLELLASFHQSPDEDARSATGRIENIPVRRLMKHARLVTAPSQRAIDELRAARVLGPEQGVRSSNPIRSAAGAPVRRRRDADDPVRLLLAGRLDDQKGISDLEGLLEQISHPVELLVAGDGPLRDEVNRLSTNLWRHTVSPLGYQSNIFDRIDEIDYIFLPSRFELNPVIIWEGWSRGRPAIGSDIEAFNDLKTSGPIHIFSDPADLDLLISRLARRTDSDFDGAIRAAGAEESSQVLVRSLRGGQQL
ncbi:glycosyltransferase [Curtobacterium sp. MMLR14_010]|uniref:glycosyltransferase n=1 Tax=Curtobacterium sp. MMLR14_010 TaxID=1898743 RepID=UPI001113E1FE|nr:glycosyltransferase [Curtobacterium sp. MMLR14_010]